MSDALSYVYAVGRDLTGGDLAELAGAGVGEGDPRLVVASGLQAVVSDVPRDEFEARALDDKLEDLGWLAATARAHHHVVDAVGSRRTVAPLSLATVYFDDDRVRELLTVRRARPHRGAGPARGPGRVGRQGLDPRRSRPGRGARGQTAERCGVPAVA